MGTVSEQCEQVPRCLSPLKSTAPPPVRLFIGSAFYTCIVHIQHTHHNRLRSRARPIRLNDFAVVSSTRRRLRRGRRKTRFAYLIRSIVFLSIIDHHDHNHHRQEHARPPKKKTNTFLISATRLRAFAFERNTRGCVVVEW